MVTRKGWFRKFLARWMVGFCPICGCYENKKIITKYNTEFTSCENECINRRRE